MKFWFKSTVESLLAGSSTVGPDHVVYTVFGGPSTTAEVQYVGKTSKPIAARIQRHWKDYREGKTDNSWHKFSTVLHEVPGSKSWTVKCFSPDHIGYRLAVRSKSRLTLENAERIAQKHFKPRYLGSSGEANLPKEFQRELA